MTSKEQIDFVVNRARIYEGDHTELVRAVIVALADQRAELVALLRDARSQIAYAGANCAPTVGNVKWLSRIAELLARLGVTP